MKKILSTVLLILIFLLTSPYCAFPDEDYPELQISSSRQSHLDTERYPSSEAIRNVLDTLKGMENLVTREFPGGAVLQGELLSPADMRRVALVSTAMDGIINLCTLHPEALHLAAEHIKTVMKRNRILGMELSVLGNSLLLTGITSGESDIKRIEKICRAINIPLVNSTRPAVSDPRMVLFEVSFTEVNRDAFEEIGVGWPASTTLTDPSGIRIGSLEPAHKLEVTIDHLVHEGKARIISKPRLTCGSGQEASFQAGGELPIPKSDAEGRLTITWKPYGIILQIAPTVDPEGVIHTQIRSEVSMVDQANVVDGIPGILTRKVDTHLSLSLGQTIVLSGLVHSDDAERITKVPLLGDIPILGEIFKSRSFQKRETELVVFLSPLRADNLEDEQGAQQVAGKTY
jgi:pilus assembly protein CpaC